MQGNPFLRIALTTMLLVGLILVLSPIFQPKIPEAGNEVNRPADAPALADDPGPQQQDAKDGAAAGEADTEAGLSAGEEPAARDEFPRQFLTLGRFDPDAGPLVVQLDSRGAMVRRIELNARRGETRFRYRDVDYVQAWIGELELEKSGDGCLVQSVAPGTPADLAGIVAGERITAVDGEPVLDPADFAGRLAELEAGSAIALAVVDTSGAPRAVTVNSVRKPLEILAPPDPSQVNDAQAVRRGFAFSLADRAQQIWPALDPYMTSVNWQARQLDDGQSVEFTHRLPKTADGRQFEVVKRFTLPAEENSWHLNLDLEVRNVGSEAAQVWYELWGPAGLPTEGWWYQQKIHGNTWAIGRMAGARDILVNTVGQGYRFLSGPQIVSDRQNGAHGSLLVANERDVDVRTIRYLAIDTLYFAVALQAAGDVPLECYSAWAAPVSQIDAENKQRAQRLTDVNFVIYGDAGVLQPWDEQSNAGAWTRSLRIFAGPKDETILESYGLGEARTFGWFWMFSKPLIWLLHVLYTITGGFSYGIAIILLTVIVRSLMIPISRKAAINAQMMQHLTPEIKELAEKYKEQPEKRMKAQQELFARYKYNPFGGCLLMFLQLPIFLGLYRGLSVDVALRDAPLIPGLGWCSNLAGPDRLFDWSGWMPGFLASETGWLGPYFNLLPVLTIVLMLIQQKMFMPPATDEQSRMMQRMMKFMMIFMAFIFFKVASGLCVYFITSSIWSIVERKLLPKPQLDVEKFEARADSPGGKSLFNRAARKDDPADLVERGQRAAEQRRQRDRQRQRKLRDRE